MINSNVECKPNKPFSSPICFLVRMFYIAMVTLTKISWYQEWDISMTDLSAFRKIVDGLWNFRQEKPSNVESTVGCSVEA